MKTDSPKFTRALALARATVVASALKDANRDPSVTESIRNALAASKDSALTTEDQARAARVQNILQDVLRVSFFASVQAILRGPTPKRHSPQTVWTDVVAPSAASILADSISMVDASDFAGESQGLDETARDILWAAEVASCGVIALDQDYHRDSLTQEACRLFVGAPSEAQQTTSFAFMQSMSLGSDVANRCLFVLREALMEVVRWGSAQEIGQAKGRIADMLHLLKPFTGGRDEADDRRLSAMTEERRSHVRLVLETWRSSHS